MRLFVAVELTGEVREYCRSLQKRLPRGIRPVPPENLHITLAFLGEQDPKATRERLRAVRFTPFTVTLDSIGMLPQPRPRIVCLTGTPAPPLTELVRTIHKVLGQRTTRPFRLHLTLGRMKGPVGITIPKPAPIRLPVRAFSLFNSGLTRGGPAYTRLFTVTGTSRPSPSPSVSDAP